jgi:NAD-dependent dihydropyrimidine dehydrogenase PreA subunit/uncharacterized protein (DUF779 family)
MLREIVHIDEELCNDCGDCVPSCHEGALQIIDNKARLVSDLMCDGLGACLGHCPQGAITIEKREAQPYNETEVMKVMVKKGENTVVAHLQHLKDHQEFEFLKEGVQFLKNNEANIGFDIHKVLQRAHNAEKHETHEHIKPMHHSGGGCPGSQSMSFAQQGITLEEESVSGKSELKQWPVQMHLINPQASYFHNSDLLVAADCVAFSLGNFHQKWLKDKTVAIACPKLDSGMEVYLNKLTSLVDDAKINTMTVMIMRVPCCGGLLQMVQKAVQNASRKVPIKAVVVGIQGEILQEKLV